MRLTPAGARWLGVWVPTAFAVLAESVRLTLLATRLPPVWVSVTAVTVTLVLALIFSSILFRGITRTFAENERLREELDRLLREEQRAKALSEALYAINRDLTSITGWDRNLPRALRRIGALVGSDLCGLVLQDEPTGDLILKSWYACHPCTRDLCPLVLPLARAAVATGSVRLFPGRDGERPEEGSAALDLPESCCVAAAAVPIRVQGDWFGALVAGFRRPHGVTEAEVALLTQVAEGAAVAFENARLYATLEGMAALRERQRLARELHDSLAQSVAFLSGRVQDLAELLEEGLHEEALQVLKQVSHHVAQAERDVREAIWELKSGDVALGGLVSALAEYLREFSRQTRIQTELVVAPDLRPRLPLHTEVQLVRIVQEALANVHKHARATRVRVTLTEEDGQQVLAVTDDGCGFDPHAVAARNRYGLHTMRERAAACGGVCTITSRRGEGTCVTVRVPVEPARIGVRERGAYAHPVGG